MNKELENGWDLYKGLYNIMLSSTKTVLTLQTMLKSLKDTVEKYAKDIENIAEKFHQEISAESAEDDVLFFYYQYLSNYLLRVSHDQKLLGKNIHSEIIDPFEMFVANFRSTNRSTATKGKEMLLKLDDTQVECHKAQENYWKLSKKAEKSGENIEKTIMLMDQGVKNQNDLQKASDQSVKYKISAQEAEQYYKQSIEICNDSRQNFEKKYPEIFTSFDYNDESRISFTKQSINNLVKLLMDFQAEQCSFDVQHQEKLTNYEEKHQQDPKFPCIKLILKGKEVDFTDIKKEEFVSYETHKREEQVQFQIQDDFIVIGGNGGNMTEKDRVKLDQVISDILIEKDGNQPRKFAIQSQSSQKNGNQNENNKEEQKNDDNNNNKAQQLTEKQTHIQSIRDILKIKSARNYFLEILWKKMQNNKQFHIKCDDEQFNDLYEILVSILQQNEKKETFNPEEFNGVLQIASRIMRIPNQKKQTLFIGDNLAKKLNQNPIFQEYSHWESLYEYISNKKTEEKINKRKLILQQSNNNGFIKGGVKKGFSALTKGIGFGLNLIGINANQAKKDEEIQMNEDEKNEINFLMLEDINCFLLNLQLSTDFSTQIIIDMATQNEITNAQIQRLLERQEDKKNDEIRKHFLSYKHKIKRTDQKFKKLENNYQHKALYAIKQSMKYLSSEDRPWNLMLVSREAKKQLEKKIYKLLLLRDLNKNQFLKDHRIAIYKAWLKTDLYKNLDYEKLKAEMKKSNLGQEKQTRIEEIIDLDVHRSLHIHKDDISHETLQNLLKTFAYENKVISYCQGMNYIAGYLYLIIRDEAETYKQFHVIMNLYFQDLFTNQFSRLKVMFYQLSRCLSIFLPQLSDHLKQENIDPEYYATGWFITIFTSVFQYALQSHMLSVIWDIFIIEGWKGFFKCVLWILKHHQSALLNMQFDDILNYLSELIKSDFFKFGEQDLKDFGIVPNIQNVKQEINSFNITTQFLEHIEEEYECFQVKVKNKLKNRGKNNQNNNNNNEEQQQIEENK